MIGGTMTATALTAALALAPLPAQAASDAAVEYSTDGYAWSAAPPASVFPASWQPVPGASATATLYVRSTRPGDTVVGVYATRAVSSDPVLLAATTVAGADGSAVALADVGACTSVAAQAVLGAGETLAVPLTVALSPDLAGGQGVTLGLDLLVDLSDTGVSELAGGCPVDPEIVAAFPGADTASEPLAGTGGGAPAAPLLAALALLVGGTAAVLAGRRGRAGDRSGEG